MRLPSSLAEPLSAVGRMDDGTIDLADTALLLGLLDYPNRDVAPERAHLAEMAGVAEKLCKPSDSVGRQADTLRQILVHEYGYAGDDETYDDPQNANLIDVIARRRGLPVALGILYLHVGHAYGAAMAGLTFPSHFVVRLSGRGERAILDPFHGGRAMAASDLRQRLKTLMGPDAEMTPGHYQAVGRRDVLIRLQNNLKVRAIGSNDLPRALAVLETMRLIAPNRGEFWWEAAMVHSRLGNLHTAITMLETYLSDDTPTPGRDQIEALLTRLRASVN